jgi:hypothetical protein
MAHGCELATMNVGKHVECVPDALWDSWHCHAGSRQCAWSLSCDPCELYVHERLEEMVTSVATSHI